MGAASMRIVGRSSPLLFVVVAACVVPTLGCEDELNFTTSQQEVFHGELLEADFIIERPDRAEHILAPGTTMELRLNMRSLDSNPGVISTSDGLFEEINLVMLPAITCDRLSAFEIEGNFLRSFIFLAPTSDPSLDGADAVLFVSLAESDRVEVRVLAGAGDRQRVFGVFHLIREAVEEEAVE